MDALGYIEVSKGIRVEKALVKELLLKDVQPWYFFSTEPAGFWQKAPVED